MKLKLQARQKNKIEKYQFLQSIKNKLKSLKSLFKLFFHSYQLTYLNETHTHSEGPARLNLKTTKKLLFKKLFMTSLRLRGWALSTFNNVIHIFSRFQLCSHYAPTLFVVVSVLSSKLYFIKVNRRKTNKKLKNKDVCKMTFLRFINFIK